MATITVNSLASLQQLLGELRVQWDKYKFLRVSIKTGKDRSLNQNNLTHAWYEQLSRELREDDVIGWKCFCKLHFGVPILRAEDDEFREAYDSVIKPLSYEKKLLAMKMLPVTSEMTKAQLSTYAEAMQAHFIQQGVRLEFPA